MAISNLLNNILGEEVISYPFEVDDKQDAIILKNTELAGKGTFKKIFFGSPDNNKSIIWINNPQYRFNLQALQAYNKIFLGDIPIFISSCNPELVPFFKQHKFEMIKVGKEAVLDLNNSHFNKKSLKELIRYGSRNGSVDEIYYSKDMKDKLEQFKLECAHGHEPQLKYFFNDIFLPENRLFVFKGNDGNWLGAITVSCRSDGNVRTDLLLRKKNAGRGIMEFLIKVIFDQLKKEKFKIWSLGEVPYIIYGSPIFSKEFIINFAGRKMRFAYNYKGLYNFKNKFNPIWKEIYICSKPKLKLMTIVKVAWISNLINLVTKKMFFLLRFTKA